MDFKAIEEDSTYRIRVPGGHTFGTVTGKDSAENTITWESDSPDSDGTHWCRPEQVVVKVADGTYLGDNGRPTR
jgi:hypothetical protein